MPARPDRILGAVVGDIVGSIYEFDNIRTKEFELIGPHSVFTDDSIMTVASMQALLDGGAADDYVRNYQYFGNKYHSSYGVRFSRWLTATDPQPYDSWGNGAPMRVSPVAWFYDTLDEVEASAAVSSAVTHDHPEGIKGAQSIAAAIFLARTGKTKDDIKRYVEDTYEYLLDFTLDDIRPTYAFDESSAGTVPPAIVAFLESTGFEDAVRGAVSIGGDSDTLAAITGSIAEAFYGVPDVIGTRAYGILSDELREVVDRFGQAIARDA